MEDNTKIYVRGGLDRILQVYDRDAAGSCEIDNVNSVSIKDANFLFGVYTKEWCGFKS